MRTARFGMMLVLGLGLTVWYLPKASAQGKSDQVTFETADAVKIVGSYYPSNKGIKAPCVLLLHDFDKQKGGHSQTQEWIDLASDLQTAGYAVLSFDFRGFGQSTTVGPGFWMPPNNHNSVLMRAGAKAPMNINAKNFPAAYFRQLVNDVAAAKAYLDNENDGSQLNSRNLVVIGAGQAAAVGMMWMDSEFKRHKAIAVPGLRGPVLQKMNADSVGEDFAAAIWLSPNPNLGGGNQSLNKDMHRWVGDIAGVRGHKVPMLFIWGKDDPAQKPVLEYLKVLDMNFARDIKKDPPVPVKGTDFTGEKYFDAKLVGSKLLDANLGTSAFITKSYLENVLKKRGAVQWKVRRNVEEYFYWKTLPVPTLAKNKGEQIPVPLPPAVVFTTR